MPIQYVVGSLVLVYLNDEIMKTRQEYEKIKAKIDFFEAKYIKSMKELNKKERAPISIFDEIIELQAECDQIMVYIDEFVHLYQIKESELAQMTEAYNFLIIILNEDQNEFTKKLCS